jgi:hypothetical protein
MKRICTLFTSSDNQLGHDFLGRFVTFTSDHLNVLTSYQICSTKESQYMDSLSPWIRVSRIKLFASRM